MEISSGIICGIIVFYGLCAILMYQVIIAFYKERKSYTYREQNIICDNTEKILDKDGSKFAFYGALLFPITIGFMFAFIFEKIIYKDILVENDEDRLISWLF